ncbi:sphingosine hydroxylase [Saccharomycopsis crataegensis]|uniref:Sphingosine hydroxylase n=1 Tax=Saccharomycopsis crataegensis TaxID=43959 RepID=A0AAV5QRR3_9ASCO|nr:sphingosine hydroxylase [Saccharomycopsis crataegensis]
MDFSNFRNGSHLAFINAASSPEVKYVTRPSLIEGIPDSILGLIAPVAIYWLMSTFFLIIDHYELSEKYRIHPSEEEAQKNKATFHEILKDVALQHFIQTVAGLGLFYFEDVPLTGFENHAMWEWKQKLPFLPSWAIYHLYWYGFSAIKIVIAFGIIDSWQYWLHRWMHINKYMYKHYHSRHHRLYVPYAFGALYNAPLEGFLLDTCGTGFAMLLTNLTPREALVLFTFSTMKTVDDHCGYAFPYDPFQIIFPNNSIYHDIHHQAFGIKTNFSQPFFTFWDTLNGTQYKDLTKYQEHRKKMSIEKYKQFLADRRKPAAKPTEEKKEK